MLKYDIRRYFHRFVRIKLKYFPTPNYASTSELIMRVRENLER